MSCTCAPALLAARNELNAVWPLRDKESDGCCGDAAHAARKSDHNAKDSGPSKGLATAYDYDEDVTEGLGDHELTGMGLVLLGDERTKYLIYEAQLLYPDGTVKPYTGINAHRHHLHHSIHDWAARDTSPWGIARAFDHQEDDMNADQNAALNGVLAAVVEIRGNVRKLAEHTGVPIDVDDVDEQAIITGVLAGLDEQVIADALSDAQAAKVADIIAERLKG